MDLKGAKDRLGFDARRAAMEIEDEFDENRWESQEALKYGGRTLFASKILCALIQIWLACEINRQPLLTLASISLNDSHKVK